MTETAVLHPIDHARKAVDVAIDSKALDVTMLNVTGVATFADYFVLLTVESTRQMESLKESLEKTLEETGAILHHREGTSDGGWILLDFGDLIVHLFAPTAREYYRLEDVWSQAVGHEFAN